MRISIAVLLVSLFSVLIGNRSACGDGPQLKVLFPAYQNPVGVGGPLMWSSLIVAGNNPNIELHVIFNPSSGPGQSTEGNYFNTAGTGAIQQLKATNATIYAYVFTSFGQRDPLLVQADILAYGQHYPGIIDGIFFDEVDSDLAKVGYYQGLRDFISEELPNAVVIGNPGQPGIPNESGQSQIDQAGFLNAFDAIVSFENFGEAYSNNYQQGDIPLSLDRSKVGHIIHTQTEWSPSNLELALARGAGFVYFTDDVFEMDNDLIEPYDMLPGYWDDFISDVSDLNSRSGYFAPGNLNGDASVNFLDISPFISALSVGEYRIQGDINCDGELDFLDISPFIGVLSGQ